MSEIAPSQSPDLSIVAPAKKLDQTLLSVNLAALHDSLNVYGRELKGGTLIVWKRALDNAEVTDAEFEAATAWWIDQRSDFPTPAEFIAWIRSHRESLASRAARDVLIERERQEEEKERERLRIKFDGWSIERLRDHIAGLRHQIVKTMKGVSADEDATAAEARRIEIAGKKS